MLTNLPGHWGRVVHVRTVDWRRRCRLREPARTRTLRPAAENTAVPANIEHHSKPELALELVEQAISTEIDHNHIITERFSAKTGVSV